MTDLAALTDAQIIGLTLWGEARSEGPDGRIAVANVIRNRAQMKRATFGLTARDVCLKPWQFSCWIEAGGAANHGLLMDTAAVLSRGGAPGPILRECLWMADGLLRDLFVDNTHGATHYLTADLFQTKPPSWAVGRRTIRIGAHVFLRVA